MPSPVPQTVKEPLALRMYLYELPEPLYSRPEVQRVTALACNATTLVNDLYSFT